MNSIFKYALALAALALATQAAAQQITFYENEGYSGRALNARNEVRNFKDSGFNDVASSVVVSGSRWEVCQHANFGGYCAVLRPGNYPSLSATGLDNSISSARPISDYERQDEPGLRPAPPLARQDSYRRDQERGYERGNERGYERPYEHPYERRYERRQEVSIVFYEHEGYRGRTFKAAQDVSNFKDIGFNDIASSVVVSGSRWEVCEHARGNGQCVVLLPGSYPSLAAVGMNDRASSTRPLNDDERGSGQQFSPPRR
jgi:Beta/Gamma crystallin